MDMENKTSVLLRLWADDTLLNIRSRELLNNDGQDIRNVDTELARVRDHTATCLQRGEITVTDFIIMLNDMTRYNRIATRWLLHQFASARINPILFSGPSPTTNPHIVEDWIADLRWPQIGAGARTHRCTRSTQTFSRANSYNNII